MASDNKWDPLKTQLLHHSLDIGSLEYDHPKKYTDNSEYDKLIGSVYSIYCTRISERMNSHKNVFIPANTTNECHSKIDPKSLAQRWGIGLNSA